MKMEIDFDSFFKGLDWSKRAVRDGAKEGMHDATDHLLAASRNLAPLKKRTLRSSAGKNVDATEAGVTGEVTFSATEQSKSGELVNYALITHEMGESFKNPTTPGTQPKYLERPLKENADLYKQLIAEGIQRELT